MLITADDIALKVGIGKTAVFRKPFLYDYFAKEVSFGGRPKKLFRVEVLERFGIAVPSGGDKAIGKIEVEPHSITKKGFEMEKVERKRAQNSSTGKPRVISEELEAKLKSLTLRNYLEQSRRDNILRCVQSAVRELWRFIEKETDKHTIESFSLYFYMKRVMRKSNHFVGYAHSEKWDLRWMEYHQKNKYNSSLPTNRWDYISLFEDAGYIGEGYGAGLLWSIDGTQFNAWVDDNGEAKAKSYLLIMDGVLGIPLYAMWLKKGETIEATAEILWRSVCLHGKPKLGIVLDNGPAFKSKEIRAMIESWYSPQELEELANNEFRKRMFGGQVKPYIYPLGKIPRYPTKAQHERFYETVDAYCHEQLSASYIGTRDSRAVAHELGSNPTQAVKKRIDKDIAFAGMLYWIYEEYMNYPQPKLNLPFIKKKGLSPTLKNLWLYCGGRINESKILCPGDIGRLLTVNANKELPNRAQYYALYAAGTKHEVKAGVGSCVVTDAKQSYNFQSEMLDASLAGKKVKVVVNRETGEGIIMKEWQKNDPDERTPDKDSLYFVGLAQDAFIRKVSDMDKIKVSTRIRKKLTQEIKKETELLAGGKIEIVNKLDVARFEQLSEAEYQVIEPEAESLDSGGFNELDELLSNF